MKNIKIKTIDECEKMSDGELINYLEKYNAWSLNYGHKLYNMIERRELKDDRIL